MRRHAGQNSDITHQFPLLDDLEWGFTQGTERGDGRPVINALKTKLGMPTRTFTRQFPHNLIRVWQRYPTPYTHIA